MANVRLGSYEIANDDLPRVCMRCDAPAVTTVSRKFSWYPSSVNLLLLLGALPALILASILSKKATVPIPFCPKHKNHWRWRTQAIAGSLLLLIVLWSSVFFLLSHFNAGKDPFAYAGLGCFVTGIAWLITALVLQNLTIKPIEITERSIKLTNVSREFADAVRESRFKPVTRTDSSRQVVGVGDSAAGFSDPISKSSGLLRIVLLLALFLVVSLAAITVLGTK